MPNSKGVVVIISVYIESKNLKSNQKTDPINPKPLCSKPRVSKTRGYDRRAQLLAYANELRHANAHQEQCLNHSRRKPKRRRWLLPVQKTRVCFFSRFDGIKRRWKYEPIATDDHVDDGEGSSGRERLKSKKTSVRYSHFCKKLRCLLKEISKVWQCKNGV
ncbi:hypothetical protein OROHE_023662 [Orobanche hederae]